MGSIMIDTQFVQVCLGGAFHVWDVAAPMVPANLHNIWVGICTPLQDACGHR